MERLTQKSINYCAEICRAQDCETYHGVRNDVCGDAAIYNRLAAYEDLEEQGRLVVLPCKVNEVVYAVDRRLQSIFRIQPPSAAFILSEVEYGVEFYATREEAEKALKGVTDDA